MTKVNEVISASEARQLLADSPDEMGTVALMLDYLRNPDAYEHRLIASKERVRALHQHMEWISKSLEKLKALIEAAMFTAYDSPEGAELEEVFKFQAGRETVTALSNGPLAEIAIGNGLTAGEFASACRPLTAKAFGEMLGLTQEAVMNNYGELFSVTKSKPTLRRLYNL